MGRRLDDDELIEHWTLVGEELDQVAGKRGPTRLAFALLLRFHTLHGRFPRGRGGTPGRGGRLRRHAGQGARSGSGPV
jgi:hypothetical protein